MTLQESLPLSNKRRQKKSPTAFELLNEHATCQFRDIPKQQLTVPVSQYQRDESEGRIAAEIAMHFDKVAFGVLLVIKRSNGELVVADGGTRLAGAKQRKDVPTVPCAVYSGLTDKQESDVFLRVNQNRRKLQTEQLHHAEIYSGRDLAVHAQALIDRLGHSNISFDSLSTMRASVKSDRQAIGTIVDLLTIVAFGRHVTARVMKGLFRLEVILKKTEKTLNRRPTIKRMKEQFPTFDNVVNAVVKPRQTGSTMEMARALARTLKITLPTQR